MDNCSYYFITCLFLCTLVDKINQRKNLPGKLFFSLTLFFSEKHCSQHCAASQFTFMTIQRGLGGGVVRGGEGGGGREQFWSFKILGHRVCMRIVVYVSACSPTPPTLKATPERRSSITLTPVVTLPRLKKSRLRNQLLRAARSRTVRSRSSRHPSRSRRRRPPPRARLL